MAFEYKDGLMVYETIEEALEVVNRWIREGSNLVSWCQSPTSEIITLKGSDGCTEEFVVFYNESEIMKDDSMLSENDEMT